MRHSTSQVVWVCYVSFWTKEREAEVQDFKEKVDNSEEKEQTCGAEILAVTSRNSKESNLETWLGSLLSPTHSPYYPKAIAPFCKQAFLSTFL